MPELPEVEVVRAGLAPAVEGATVAAVTVFDERSLRRHPGPSEDFVDRMVGAVLGVPKRRGKFIWIPIVASTGSATESLPGAASTSSATETGSATEPPFPERVEGNFALAIHLGMSGQVLLRDRATDDPLTRIRLELEHPVHGELRLNFVDQRIFGSMAIVPLVQAVDAPHQRIPEHVTHIARDPLDEFFDDRIFVSQLARKASGIKRVLLDQSVISGIGNIYADEALWAAKLHYDQPANSLSRASAVRLLAEVRTVLTKALAEGGTSFDAQYVNVNGASGYFSHSLNAYGQQGKPCPRCGRSIVRERFMNRGSHFCPRCQKLRVPPAA
jgi:formamidopyrimidine-DNA glycosylase